MAAGHSANIVSKTKIFTNDRKFFEHMCSIRYNDNF